MRLKSPLIKEQMYHPPTNSSDWWPAFPALSQIYGHWAQLWCGSTRDSSPAALFSAQFIKNLCVQFLFLKICLCTLYNIPHWQENTSNKTLKMHKSLKHLRSQRVDVSFQSHLDSCEPAQELLVVFRVLTAAHVSTHECEWRLKNKALMQTWWVWHAN